MLEQLALAGRARLVELEIEQRFWVATERMDQMAGVHPSAFPTFRLSDLPDRPTAIRELLRSRLEILGPTSAGALARSLGILESDADIALAQLEGEGVILRGSFTPGREEKEWCDRRLLARIHRYTLNRLRAEIAPVSATEYMRFLLAWQRVESDDRVRGLEGLANVVSLLDGYECPAAAWEQEVLASRCEDYDPAALDTLCLTGRVAWGRVAGGRIDPKALPDGSRQDDASENDRDGGQQSMVVGSGIRPIRSTPIALFLRTNADHWFRLSEPGQNRPLSTYGSEVLSVLQRRGASFFPDLVQGSGLLPSQVEQALAELAASGVVTSDSFAGLRVLLTPSNRRKPLGGTVRRYRTAAVGLESAGRWSLLRPQQEAPEQQAIEACAWSYLRRYGVVFKRVLARESLSVPWRKLAMVYRRLEARGEIRGGRFVQGMSGEQFALPDAVARLRAVRREAAKGRLVSLSAADPLNLIGIITPGARIAALRRNRILFEDGVPLAALEGGVVRPLAEYPSARNHEIERALVRRRLSVRPQGEAATG